MKSYKNIRKNKHNYKRNKKGGLSFLNRSSVPSTECDINKLSTLTKMPNVNDINGQLKPVNERLNDLSSMTNNLRENYKKCCPKGFMGRKNPTSYCNQLDTTFKSIEQHKQDISGYYGDETNVQKIKDVMNAPIVQPVNKPWYQFWGGKRTRKYKKYNKKRTFRKHK